jgi:hypothetical protein
MFKNSFASPPSEPFFTMRIFPTWLTTNKRPEPSGASPSQTGRSISKLGKTGWSFICGNDWADTTTASDNRQKAWARKNFDLFMARSKTQTEQKVKRDVADFTRRRGRF